MNTLENDFNQFMNRRLTHVKSHLPVIYNAAAIKLYKSLNQEQSQLLMKALDYLNNRSAIIEESAYRQGMIDALNVLNTLRKSY